eukprot:Seg140.3 transcript_id=Seg140.3/GoldUCD/mRNA.D3Y31 product="Isopentenyl-diphosphate Delta-isomerase 1" protein_id=Seg140.3/GoldUCD/D3Y31
MNCSVRFFNKCWPSHHAQELGPIISKRGTLFCKAFLKQECVTVRGVKRFSDSVNIDTSVYHKSQVDQLDDKCIVVDKYDRITGLSSKKECHLITKNNPEGILHRAFSVLLFNSNNELLLQQRSMLKITYPGHYTNTCCSHPRATNIEMNDNEHIGVKIAAQRRMNFELGIPTDQMPIEDIHSITRIQYSSPAGGVWAENEVDHVLFIKKDVELNVNKEEVSGARYFQREELDKFMANAKAEGLKITPWFDYIYNTFLSNWWEKLSTGTEKLVELKDDKIWRAGSIESI